MRSLQALPISALLLCISIGAAQQPKPLEYCKVATDFARYDHKVLRIKGVYRSGGEIMSFYDPSCPWTEMSSWVDYGSEFKSKSLPEVISAMNKLIDADGRAQIDIVAEFDGPKPVKIPRGTPPEVADAMRGTNARWGHANQFRFRMRFHKVLAVSPVAKTTPWPQ